MQSLMSPIWQQRTRQRKRDLTAYSIEDRFAH